MLALLSDPSAWAALVTLAVLEVVLGVDNLVFIALLTNRLPPARQSGVRRLGIGLALGLRLALLSAIAWLTRLTATVVDLGIQGPPDAHGEPAFSTDFSARDLILLAGGLFLLYKATAEIGHHLDGEAEGGHEAAARPALGVGAALVQILALDMVFSIDSILTAVGMTDQLPIMMAAVVIAVGAMLVAADPLARFIGRNPSVVMLALAFLLMIGLVLVADALGVHVPRGYVYGAMGFSSLVEGLNLLRRRRTRH